MIKNKIYKSLFYTEFGILLKGFLIPSQNKRFFEIWFPYSIEAARIIKPSKFLCATNFSNFYYYKELKFNIDNNALNKAYFTVLEIVDVEIIHYEIFAMSQEPQKLKLEEAFEKYKKSWHRRINQDEDENLRIIVKAVPTNVDLIFRDEVNTVEEGKEDQIEFVSPSEQPVYGEEVYIMKPQIVEKFLNSTYSSTCKTCFKAGYHKMYEENSVSIFLNSDPLFNRHFAVFGFSGAGKSNLLSTIIYKALKNSDTDVNIVIFDANSEYVGLLFDALFFPDIDSQVIFLENPGGELGRFLERGLPSKKEQDVKKVLNIANQFFNRLSWPDELVEGENKEIILTGIWNLLATGKVKIFFDSYTIKYVLNELYFPELEKRINTIANFKTKEKELLKEIEKTLIFYLGAYGLLNINYNNFAHHIIIDFLDTIQSLLRKKMRKNKLYLNKLYSYSLIDKIISYKDDVQLTVATYLEISKSILENVVLKNDLLSEYEHSLNTNHLVRMLHDNKKSLIIIMSDEDNNLRKFAHKLGSKLYRIRKNGEITNSPQVLFLFEEADLFIPMTPVGNKLDKEIIQLSKEVATTFARRGRKYKLGIGISTQRTTYLDTNIVSQFATYFVSKLPRRIDRERVAEAFGVEQQVIDRTLFLDTGEWMIISHSGALNRKSIPILVRFENANDRVKEYFKKITKKMLQDIERQQEDISQKDMPEQFNNVEESLLPVYVDLNVDLESGEDASDTSNNTNNPKTHDSLEKSVNEPNKNIVYNKDKYFEFFSRVVESYKPDFDGYKV